MRRYSVWWISLVLGCTPSGSTDEESSDGDKSDDGGSEDTEVYVEETGVWVDTDDTDPSWLDEDTAPEQTWLLEVNLTVDDAWEAWVDAVPLGSGSTWQHSDVFDSDVTLNRDGPHVIAVHGWDEHHVISGFLSAVYLDGELEAVTGGGAWHMIAEDPGANWMFPEYDDSHWGVAQLCSDTSPWGTLPADLLSTGAQWVWDTTNCRALGEAWFRLEIEIPAP